MPTQTPKEVVQQRDSLYGGAWMLHGQLLRPLAGKLAKFHVKYPPLFFPWHLIFNKLLRILTSPMKRDHWIDIQGYAQLVINEMDKLSAEQHNEQSKQSDK